MTILLPIKLRATGGTSSFARKFQASMQSRGYNVIFAPSVSYDILLASPRAPIRLLLEARMRRRPIVQRLDGVYYPAIAGRSYSFHNASLWYIRKYFATTLIYQSRFSAKSCDRYLGASQLPSQIIYNGVDTDIFSPTGSTVDLRDNPNQQILITASRFRRKDQIIPLLVAFAQYRQEYTTNCKLLIIGNFEGEVADIPQIKAGEPGVTFIGTIPHSKLPQYLRSGDAFLFTHRNPPCPNNVIEAMACGLPICGVADGSMSELILPGKEGELVQSSGDPFTEPRTFSDTEFADNMAKILANQHVYSSAARDTAYARFSLEAMVDAYCDAIESTIF
ncbi:MAG: glycosyltransferase family 4 protein [Candidatus Andersenbacteria bacterium]